MAMPPELFYTPASGLNSFVTQWLQPTQEWKKEVLQAVWTVEQFLRQERFQEEHELGQDLRVLKMVKVELVVFLNCFHSFKEEAKHHQDVLNLLFNKLRRCSDLLKLEDMWVAPEVSSAIVCTIQSRKTVKPITVTIKPAFRALGPSVPNSQPDPEIYVSLIEAYCRGGNFNPSFSELQRNFVRYRPAKLKSLLRLVKHWYLQLLTIYAWEMGTQESEKFELDEGLATVLELLQAHTSLCIYWTKYYTFQDPVIEDFVRRQLKKKRPIILDPADPTHNVAEGYRWDVVAERASQCLKQDCCYRQEDPVLGWNVKRARDIQVTVEQRGCSDLILTVNPYEPIKKLKKKIRWSWGFSGQQHLSFQDPSGEQQLLSSSCSLASYGIFSNTRIYLLEALSSDIRVIVKNPDGGSHAYTIDPRSFIVGLKQQIEDKQGMLKRQQQLEFRGQVLQDWVALGSYGIRDSDILILSKKKAI
ncbi:hypothetical protein MC885_008218 [Smutsia gigantea]|nr:hypothetical protein MC885_008218 [Smutsia gigantea]